MSVTIKSTTGAALYTAPAAATAREAVTEAVRSGANLFRANLNGADLAGANLFRANLNGADLDGADLAGAYLAGADLAGADLDGADLAGANLAGANLAGADLDGANLDGADLARANLNGANLDGADLARANLNGANLTRLKNADAALASTRILPDEGDLIGWKLASGSLVKLLIPSDARRSNASGRKCRADRAVVLEITDRDGNAAESAASNYSSTFVYRVGETVTPTEPFDENRWNDCAPGIHFFITRIEAENYA